MLSRQMQHSTPCGMGLGLAGGFASAIENKPGTVLSMGLGCCRRGATRAGDAQRQARDSSQDLGGGRGCHTQERVAPVQASVVDHVVAGPLAPRGAWCEDHVHVHVVRVQHVTGACHIVADTRSLAPHRVWGEHRRLSHAFGRVRGRTTRVEEPETSAGSETADSRQNVRLVSHELASTHPLAPPSCHQPGEHRTDRVFSEAKKLKLLVCVRVSAVCAVCVRGRGSNEMWYTLKKRGVR